VELEPAGWLQTGTRQRISTLAVRVTAGQECETHKKPPSLCSGCRRFVPAAMGMGGIGGSGGSLRAAGEGSALSLGGNATKCRCCLTGCFAVRIEKSGASSARGGYPLARHRVQLTGLELSLTGQQDRKASHLHRSVGTRIFLSCLSGSRSHGNELRRLFVALAGAHARRAAGQCRAVGRLRRQRAERIRGAVQRQPCEV